MSQTKNLTQNRLQFRFVAGGRPLFLPLQLRATNATVQSCGATNGAHEGAGARSSKGREWWERGGGGGCGVEAVLAEDVATLLKVSDLDKRLESKSKSVGSFDLSQNSTLSTL